MVSTDFEIALTHLREGRAADAFTILSRIVDRWPEYAAAQVAYAQALHTLGQPEASFQAWSRAEALVSHSGVVASGLRSSAAAMFPPDEPEAESTEPADVEVADDAMAPQVEPEAIVAEEPPVFYDTPEMDPALFVPIAAPMQGPDVEEGVAQWDDGPSPDDAPASAEEHPEWNGGYQVESGDGANPDLELDAPPPEADLDRLIDELQTARIVPADDPASIPPPDLSDDIDDVVSETLARIYATQNQFSEAARVYERLALENPDRAEEYNSKASEMRARDR